MSGDETPMPKGLNEDEAHFIAVDLHDYLVGQGLIEDGDATFTPLCDRLEELLEPYFNCHRNYN